MLTEEGVWWVGWWFDTVSMDRRSQGEKLCKMYLIGLMFLDVINNNIIKQAFLVY